MTIGLKTSWVEIGDVETFELYTTRVVVHYTALLASPVTVLDHLRLGNAEYVIQQFRPGDKVLVIMPSTIVGIGEVANGDKLYVKAKGVQGEPSKDSIEGRSKLEGSGSNSSVSNSQGLASSEEKESKPEEGKDAS